MHETGGRVERWVDGRIDVQRASLVLAERTQAARMPAKNKNALAISMLTGMRPGRPSLDCDDGYCRYSLGAFAFARQQPERAPG